MAADNPYDFTDEHRLKACAGFVHTLNSVAGCDAKKIKALMNPKMIDAYLKMTPVKDKK